jgi:hypothetical protein
MSAQLVNNYSPFYKTSQLRLGLCYDVFLCKQFENLRRTND